MTSATAKYHDMLNSVREFMKLHEVITRPGHIQVFVQGGHMELVYIRYLKIFGLEKYFTHVRKVGPVHEDFIVPVRHSIYISLKCYIVFCPVGSPPTVWAQFIIHFTDLEGGAEPP